MGSEMCIRDRHKGGKFVDFDIDEALAMKKDVDEYMYEISKTLV